jgi:hypothetical protein
MELPRVRAAELFSRTIRIQKTAEVPGGTIVPIQRLHFSYPRGRQLSLFAKPWSLDWSTARALVCTQGSPVQHRRSGVIKPKFDMSCPVHMQPAS